MSLMSLNGFSLSFCEKGRTLRAVNDISMKVDESEMVALIGESGCGKSATALSLIGLENERAVMSGKVLFKGINLLDLSEKEWLSLRGKEISMIFQEPMTALNPLIKAGKQVLENLMVHSDASRKEGKAIVLDMLESVGLDDAERIYNSYPHQLSGGQRQRIMIALALINNPSLLIADEPTTALDVTIQAEIIDLIRKMNREKKTAVLLISHNLSLVKGLTERSYIMYSGSIVESGMTDEILTSPIHPYTRGLLASVAHQKSRGKRLFSIPGNVPPLEERSSIGCPFAPRCPVAADMCFSIAPAMREEGGRAYACLLGRKEIERRMENAQQPS